MNYSKNFNYPQLRMTILCSKGRIFAIFGIRFNSLIKRNANWIGLSEIKGNSSVALLSMP
jgi:hypothetical protein